MIVSSDLKSKISMSLIFLSIFALIAVLLSNTAFAAANNDCISATLATIVNQLQGPMGKAIASIAVVALGIGLFLGKLSWGLAVATGVGIALIFSASKIVGWLDTTGTSTGTTLNSTC